MSFALCVGVAFLLLAGSAFAQTIGTTAVATTDVVVYAQQSARANVIYTIPTSGTIGLVKRTMGVGRQAGNTGLFNLQISLPPGFAFQTALTTGGTGITVDVAGTGFTCVNAPFQGGKNYVFAAFGAPPNPVTTDMTFVVYQCQFATASPATSPTISIPTAGWKVYDLNTTPSLNTIGNTGAIKVQTFDSNSGIEFDNGPGSTASATWLKAANGMTVSITPTRAVIDVTQSRQKFVVGGLGGTDTATNDNDALLNVAFIDKVYGNGGALYTLGTDNLYLTLSSGSGDCAMAGVSNFLYNPGAASQVQVTNAGVAGLSAAQKACTVATTLVIPGANTALPLAAASAAIPLQLVNDGTTTLAKRIINIKVDQSVNFGAGQSVVNNLQAATTLTTWEINGAVLLANWSNANTAAFKSRFYIFNESPISNATIYAKVFTIPLIGGTTAGAQIGNTVQFTQTLGAGAGMTIRLEDIINAANSGMTTTNLAGPDSSYNVAVEITIFAPQNQGSFAQAVSGYTQTMNLNATMTFGLTPMTRVE